MVAVESGRDPLVQRGARQKVAGHLLLNEAVVGQVAVEGGDYPVPPAPHGALGIVVEAVGVGVSRHVEPVHGHALAVPRDESARSGRERVRLLALQRRGPLERAHLAHVRRQAGEIEGHAAKPRAWPCRGRGSEAFCVETG